MNIQFKVEKNLQRLDAELISIDPISGAAISRLKCKPRLKDCNYMVHSFNEDGDLCHGYYDLNLVEAQAAYIHKIQKWTRNPKQEVPALAKRPNLEPIGVFHTPANAEEMADYLGKFSGSESVAAITCAYMMHNLIAAEVSK